MCTPPPNKKHARAVGPGPLFFVVCSETFPASIRDSALSASVAISWIFNLIVSFGFPVLKVGLVVVAVVCLLCFVCVRVVFCVLCFVCVRVVFCVLCFVCV